MKPIRGRYINGRIELTGPVENIPEGPVQVYLIPLLQAGTEEPLQFGKYAGGKLSDEEDFRSAEWRGEA
jgi:hypothetical protein